MEEGENEKGKEDIEESEIHSADENDQSAVILSKLQSYVNREVNNSENGNNCLVECAEDLPPRVASSETDSSNFTEMKVSLPKPRRTLHAPTMDKTTRMMLLVTVTFIVSMLPALVIGVVHGGNPSSRFKGANGFCTTSCLRYTS